MDEAVKGHKDTDDSVNVDENIAISLVESVRGPAINGPTTSDSPNRICLFRLPEEIQEIILDQLGVADLVSCAQVCKLWRTGINASHIWKKWCSKESYKPEMMDRHADSALLDEELQGMGLWRVIYGWHAKVKFKWKHQSFTKFRLADCDSPLYAIASDGDSVVTGHADSSLILWSMKKIPSVVARFRGALNDYPVISLELQKNFIVVLQRRLLQVFTLGDEGYKVSDLKCFELGDEDIEQINRYFEHESDYTSWYEERYRVQDPRRPVIPGPLMYTLTSDKLLFASLPCGNEVMVWTVPHSEVHFTVRIPSAMIVCQIIKDDQSVYFVCRDQVTHFFKYEPETQSYVTIFSVPGHKEVVMGSELVIAIPAAGDVALKRIWAYKKGDYVKPAGVRTISGHSISVFSPHCVIYSEMTTVTIWDPLDSKNNRQFAIEEPVSMMFPAFSSFALFLNYRSLSFWDWKTGERIYWVYTGLQWTGNFAKLVWANATTILHGGANNQLDMLSILK